MPHAIALTILFVFLLGSCGQNEPSAEELKNIHLKDRLSRMHRKINNEKYQLYADATSLHKITDCVPETAPSEYLLCPIKFTLHLSDSSSAQQLNTYSVMRVRYANAGWVSGKE